MKRTFRTGATHPLGFDEQQELEPDDGFPNSTLFDRVEKPLEENAAGNIACDLADEMIVPIWQMKITQSAYQRTVVHLLDRPPEAAGILLGPSQDDLLVTHFIPDLEGEGHAASFRIHAASLNKTLKRVKSAALNCKGIVHSHPSSICQPSLGDVAYLKRLFALPANERATQFFMPIVCDGRMFPYVFAAGRVWIAELVLV